MQETTGSFKLYHTVLGAKQKCKDAKGNKIQEGLEHVTKEQ